jgi:GNAT superfamily N-acetyltransferase
MTVGTPAASRLVLLGDGRSLFVRTPTDEDRSVLPELRAVPFAYMVCNQEGRPSWSPCGCAEPCEHHEPAVVAALERDGLVAAAWLHRDDNDPSTGKFGLAILPAFSRAGIAPVLLGELAERASHRGLREIRSCVGRGTRDPLADCRKAGVPVLSSMSFGGVTEVVLGVPTSGAAGAH